MGPTASGGRRGAPRVLARRSRHRSSRARIGLLALVLAVPIVAGFAVAQVPGGPIPAPGQAVTGAVPVDQTTALDPGGPAKANDPAVSGIPLGVRPAAPAQAGTPARPAPAGPPPTSGSASLPAAAAPGLAHGSVDPADPDPDATPDPDDIDAVPPLPGGPAAEPLESPQPPSLEPEALTGYVWPLRGARVTTWFGDTEDGFIVLRGKRIHDGLDLTTFCGQRVLSAHDGTVSYAGRAFGPYIGFDGPLDAFYDHLRAGHDWMSLPRVVVIDDGNGYRSAYVHLGSHSVKPGDRVKAGDVIGKEGATGHASGCHLHYMLIRMDGPFVPVAPALVKKWLYPARVRERIDPTRVLDPKLKAAARRVPGINPPKVPFRYVAPTRPRSTFVAPS